MLLYQRVITTLECDTYLYKSKDFLLKPICMLIVIVLYNVIDVKCVL